jgi:membrane-associated phospholipid phosphatase
MNLVMNLIRQPPLPLELSRPLFWLPPLLALIALFPLLGLRQNLDWFLLLNTLATQLPDRFWSVTTVLGDTLVALTFILVLLRARPDLVMAAMLAAIPATLLTHGLKDLADVARPFAQLGDAIHVIGPALRSGSFPSGHTTTTFTVAAILVAGLRPAWIGWLIVAAACLIGLSRVAVGAHWPADIAGGMLCGWVSGLFGVWLERRLAWQNHPRILSGVRLLLVACALTLLIKFNSGYPLARPFEQGLALAVLLVHFLPGWRLDRRPAA